MPKAKKADWELSLDQVAVHLKNVSAALDEQKAQAKKDAAQSKKDAAQSKKEIAELRELNRQNSKLIGTYISDEGEMLEQQVVGAIINKMALGDVRLDEVIADMYVHGKYGNGQFDWIGINGKITIVGETRRTLERGDARRFVNNRVKLFKRALPHYTKGREVRGAIVYQTAKAGAIKEALDLQMMVFLAKGKKTLLAIKTPDDIPPKRTETKTYKRS